MVGNMHLHWKDMNTLVVVAAMNSIIHSISSERYHQMKQITSANKDNYAAYIHQTRSSLLKKIKNKKGLLI